MLVIDPVHAWKAEAASNLELTQTSVHTGYSNQTAALRSNTGSFSGFHKHILLVRCTF